MPDGDCFWSKHVAFENNELFVLTGIICMYVNND